MTILLYFKNIIQLELHEHLFHELCIYVLLHWLVNCSLGHNELSVTIALTTYQLWPDTQQWVVSSDVKLTSYNNCNPGVLWASRRVASPSIEIPIHFRKKKFADKLHKSYKKHPWQTSPTFSGHFTLQAEPKINWNNYISMVLWACFSNKVCIYQKTNNQNGGCYDHMTHEITLAGSHSLHWGRVQWKIPCLRAKRFS